MVRAAIRIGCSLTRLDTCALVFASVFLPTYYQRNDVHFALTHAVPILTTCMAGFVINDLSDIEKDRENHPRRPLPSNSVSELGASVIYFILLTISLAAIKIYVLPPHIYLYLLLLIGLINYNYVVSYMPIAKNVYVAMVGLIPIFILASLLANTASVWVIAPSLFLFLLGREMLMDVEDAAGDAQTLTKAIGLPTAENIAFTLKLTGTLGLCFLIRGTQDVVIISSLAVLDLIFMVLWKRRYHRKSIIHAMKAQLLVGIYYLVV
jgi:geranylgeranylglycerol-phosphate geranylgeranyltransferase